MDAAAFENEKIDNETDDEQDPSQDFSDAREPTVVELVVPLVVVVRHHRDHVGRDRDHCTKKKPERDAMEVDSGPAFSRNVDVVDPSTEGSTGQQNRRQEDVLPTRRCGNVIGFVQVPVFVSAY